MAIAGSRGIENAAVDFVIDYERRHGRIATNARGRPGFPGDVESDGRIIEIKAVGRSQRGWFLPIETTQHDRALADDSFYVYVVENVRQGDPSQFQLKILEPGHLRRLLERAKLRSYYEMPWPTVDYDETPFEVVE